MNLLISGVFFQTFRRFGIGFDSKGEEGSLILEQVVPILFCGKILSNPDPEKGGVEYLGVMLDEFGKSSLTEIKVTETKLSFMKSYEGRGNHVFCEFERREGDAHLEGKWRINDDGIKTEGVARCFINEPGEEFFLPSISEDEGNEEKVEQAVMVSFGKIMFDLDADDDLPFDPEEDDEKLPF